METGWNSAAISAGHLEFPSDPPATPAGHPKSLPHPPAIAAGCFKVLPTPSARLAEYLITDLAPHEITSRNSRAIDIPGIPMRSLVEIILIGVEDILYSGVHLQGCGLEDREVVRQLQVQVEEITSLLLTILGNVTRQVLHQHAARIGSRQ